MEIIGHRGAKGLAPENSLESIKMAIKHKVDMIEIDARMQAGTVVLVHDTALKSEAYCTMRHALNEIDGKVPINIEVKEKRVIGPLSKLLENYKGKVLFSSFKFEILKEIEEKIPGADLAVIEKWSGLRALTYATLLETNRIHINQKWLWGGFVKSLKSQGYSVYAYTVNDPEQAKDLKRWGIKGIFTDFPNRFKK